MPSNSQEQYSYTNHSKLEKKKRLDNALPTTYVRPEGIDAWRHTRMRNTILPLIRHYKTAKWITIGDGNFGSDAHYFTSKQQKVLATSISDETLAVANDLGFIKEYAIRNAEKIEEVDDSFDFVFCKEAFHHFPRPYIGFYEMLRVASKAVVLIEPQGKQKRILDSLKRKVKQVFRKDTSFDFEVSGNFIFRLDIDEIIKIMTALNYQFVAYKKFSDFFMPAVSKKIRKKWNIASIAFNTAIAVQNVLCGLRLMDHGLATVIAFKESVDLDLQKDLRKNGYVVKELPKNPFL